MGCTISASFSTEIAKAMAILRGILFAVDIGLLPITIESDAKYVVETINLEWPVALYSDLGIVVYDILGWLSKLPISVCFSSRMRNNVAHGLAV
ncbi:hypothetical protein Q3G72_006828 [Acer saccharum]|nr:hypothetical protein Q3G72_006828 [Acer saccharum]